MIQRVIFTETTEENAENTTVLLTSPEIKYDYTIGLDFAPTGITPAAGKVFSFERLHHKVCRGTVPQLNEESASQAYLLNSKKRQPSSRHAGYRYEHDRSHCDIGRRGQRRRQLYSGHPSPHDTADEHG